MSGCRVPYKGSPLPGDCVWYGRLWLLVTPKPRNPDRQVRIGIETGWLPQGPSLSNQRPVGKPAAPQGRD